METKKFIITEQNVEEYVNKIATFIKTNVDKAKRSGVVLGMSGGIDCAVVARLCQVAQVPICLVLMPDGDTLTQKRHVDHAMELINTFNFDYKVINIYDACKQIETHIDETLSSLSFMNIRPRVRMTTLYAIAQNNDAFVIGTGNLDERLLGYFTKWGDGGCDLNPLAMLTKQEVRTLARYLQVPSSIIDKAPSAGLFEGQTDEDELGFTYDEIDQFILYKTTGDRQTDERLQSRIKMAEHKLKPIIIYEGE